MKQKTSTSFASNYKSLITLYRQIQHYRRHNYLVMFSSRLATMLFMASKGLASRAFVTQPSLAVKALSCLTREPADGNPRPNTFLPVLSGGNADSIFVMISTKACTQHTSTLSFTQLLYKSPISGRFRRQVLLQKCLKPTFYMVPFNSEQILWLSPTASVKILWHSQTQHLESHCCSLLSQMTI